MSERRIFTRLEPSCMFPDDKELGPLILGKKQGHRWTEIVKIEERHGFPRVDPLYGGREWAAIVEFYERRRRSLPPAVTTLSEVDAERAKENWGYTDSLVRRKAERAKKKAAREAAAAARTKPKS